jgi:hypothetical protein
MYPKHRLMAPEGDGGGGMPDTAWIPADHKDYVTNKGWKTPADVVTSAVNLEKLLGADKAGRAVVWPKDDTDIEGWKAVRAKLGVPADASGYTVPEQLKEAMKADPMVAKFGEVALKYNLPVSAYQGLLTDMNALSAQMEQQEANAAKVESEKQLEALKAEWGNEFPAKAEHAKRFLRASGWSEQEIQEYEAARGTAKMLKDFHGWGSKLGEGGFVKGDGGGFSGNKGQVQKQIDELRTKRENNQVSQSEYLSQMENLHKQLQAA